ncbi:MAG TPA: NAD-dependent epimerase/dehydratase family protein, partial [Ktedonobacteraceae bacterium]|nr:NAD-dependent epimerase/dehydratase family protein [Ktedonobacteraceae bacterium]
MKAFVTGGSGFVGGTLVQMLVSRGNTVKALARSERAADRIRALGAEPVRGDIEQLETLAQGLSGCDVVFHTAAALDFGNNTSRQEQVNIEGTRNIIEATRRGGVKRLVTVSASSIIADGRPINNADESRPLPRHFVGPYSRTKAAAERLILAANSASLTTVAVRPPGIWGLGDSSILPQMTQMAKSRQFIWFDHGRYAYTTCHVANVCEGLILAAERGRGGEAYFVTDGPPILFREFVLGLLGTQGLTVGERSIPWRLALSMA